MYAAQEPDNHTIICYGSYDDKIWLNGNGLQAYDINNLEEVANQQIIAAANNFNANNFPDDQPFIDAHLEKGFINFRGIDEEEY